jgi:CheY-like chemotaxis protein
MHKSGPIVIVDDDKEDLELYNLVLQSMKVTNQVLLFDQASEFLKYMRGNNETVFFILCDINMPQMDGFELRNEINLDAHLSAKSIPFLFFSTSGNMLHVSKAFQSPIQGYFLKPSTFDEISTMFRSIVTYWNLSSHPVIQVH